jgi:hypothetical protein
MAGINLLNVVRTAKLGCPQIDSHTSFEHVWSTIMSMNKKETAALAAALAKVEALESAAAAAEQAMGNLQAIVAYTDDDGTVDVATLRIASCTRIKGGLGKRLAGVLAVHSDAIFKAEDGDGTEGMTEAEATALLDSRLSVRISRCMTRFEEQPDKPVDKWASKAPAYKARSTNGAGSRGNSTQYTMGGRS